MTQTAIGRPHYGPAQIISKISANVFVLLALLVMQGCSLLQPAPAPPPPPGTKVDWVQHLRNLTLLQEWKLQGKIGVRNKTDGGSAYIDWSQSFDSFYIVLSGPLGQGTTIVSGNSTGARLQQSSGTYVAESPQELVYEHTGWEIPIDDLLYWVKGMPAPTGNPVITRTPLGTLATLKQDGWQLEYANYTKTLGNLLPQKIRIHKGNLKVVLVIKSWQPLPQDADS